MFIYLYIYIFMNVYMFRRGYISIVVMGDASDIIKYGRRTPEL